LNVNETGLKDYENQDCAMKYKVLLELLAEVDKLNSEIIKDKLYHKEQIQLLIDHYEDNKCS
jgi:hypothetical protein